MKSRLSKLLAALLTFVLACAFTLAFVGVPQLPTTSVPDADGARHAWYQAPAAPDAEGIAGAEGATAAFDGGSATGDDPAVYEPGTALVTFADGATPDQVLDALVAIPELVGATIEEQIGDDLLKVELPGGLGVSRAVELLSDVQPVTAAQPNYRYYIQEAAVEPAAVQAPTPLAAQSPGLSAGAVAPATDPASATAASSLTTQALAVNDPYYTQNRQWALPSINAPDAWQTVSNVTSPQVTVAVMDEGFLTYHEDLENVITSPYDAVESKSSTLAAYNEGHSEHGTHVAGIIAAQANNAKGIAGVAYNTSAYNTCKVMPIKVADSKGNITTDTLVKGYNYLLSSSGGSTVAKKLNVRVVNLSLGTSRSNERYMPDRNLRTAIANAWSSGIVTVAAACNIDDERYNTAFKSYPCDFPNVVGVISLERASNSDGVERDPTSNFNKTSLTSLSRLYDNESKNISAPGAGIYSTYADDRANPVINQYRSMSGTSMATPVVAGVLALMFKANPYLDAQQATKTLYKTARDLTQDSGTATGWDRATGYGEADAAAATAAVAPSISGPSTISYDSTGSFSVYVGGTRQDAASFTWSSSNANVAKIAQTTSDACTVAPLSGGTVTITAKRGSFSVSRKITVTWPTVEGPTLVARGSRLTYSVKVGSVAEPASSWVWTSSNPDVMQITAAGTATARAEGATTLTARNTVNGCVITTTATVSSKLSVALLSVSVPAVTYTGAALTPKPVVTNGSIALTEGTDYRIVRYANNVNAGTAQVVIEGMGSYADQATKSFTVRPASISGATITLSATSFTYNGKVRKPTVKSVRLAVGGTVRTLASGADYTLTNAGVKAGIGKVVVKGARNFTGTATKTYVVKVVKRSVYRLCNKKTGRWFYTMSTSERAKKLAAGWTSKGIAFKTPSKSTKPVYRLYNSKTKSYRYTASAKQRKSLVASGWKYQKIAFYSDGFKAKRVYAFYRKSTKSWRYSTSRSIAKYTRKSTLCYVL